MPQGGWTPLMAWVTYVALPFHNDRRVVTQQNIRGQNMLRQNSPIQNSPARRYWILVPIDNAVGLIAIKGLGLLCIETT